LPIGDSGAPPPPPNLAARAVLPTCYPKRHPRHPEDAEGN
jgi:hypothetical protein